MRAIVIGAGPAGLTAAHELLKHTDIQPVVLELSGDIGGISKTINYKGNRIDIGGHRFFSKSDRVMEWWQQILPVEQTDDPEALRLRYQGQERELPEPVAADPETTDEVMLVRKRLSRIYYGKRFYNYPVTLDATTVRNLGFGRLVKIGASYLKARIRPLPEKSLEEFYINRFGRELYNTFFRDYTMKVWGIPVSEIAPDWGAQRVKGLSISGTLKHAVKQAYRKQIASRIGRGTDGTDIAQKDTETSLIEAFLYPKLGPGQMWEIVARRVREQGGEVHLHKHVTGIEFEGDRAVAVTVTDTTTGETERLEADYVFSTMPVSELVQATRGAAVPDDVRRVATELPYRDFITVGVLCKRLLVTDEKTGDLVPDNWIYIQEPEVEVGRLQIFNNWSPYLVADADTVWVGMEYFVSEGDELWTKSDADMAAFGVAELAQIGIVDPADVLDTTVHRVKKTYPAYFGTYAEFDKVKEFTDRFENLFLLGRNGQHRYNNQDHSMLTAMAAVENIRSGRTDKANIWDVNVEQEYHESK